MLDAILAIETSSAACSVGLKLEQEIFSRQEVLPRRHQEKLPAMIEEVLADANIESRDLTGVAFGCGPGSFTGLRLAAATAQAWSLAHDLPVYAVSSLGTLALRAAWDFSLDCAIGVLVKARPGEVYRADFDWSDQTLVRISEDRRLSASEVQFQVAEGQLLRLVGDGCLEVDCDGFETHSDVLPNAEAVLGLMHEVSATSPGMALPTYLQADSEWQRR